MKVNELLESVDEPLITTILKNALAKGKQVRVYYKGDGGKVTLIDWDPPADAGSRRGTYTGPDNGVTSFKLTDDRWVVIGDQNIDKLVLSKRMDGDVEVLTLKQESGPVNEGTTDSRDWVNLQDAEFKQLITDAGWMLKKPPVYGMEHGFFGGTIRATARAAARSLLTLEEQRKLIMKLIGKRLIQLSERGLICTVAPYNVRIHAGSFQIRPNTALADIVDALEDGMHLKHDGSAFDAYWSVRIPKDIVASTAASFTDIFRKMEGDTDEDE